MQKAFIHYFTGTGNTAHAANLVSKEFQKKGYDTKIIQVKKGVLPPSEIPDLQIVLYPVYALSLSRILQGYMRKLPKSKQSKAAVIANHGMLGTKGGLETGYEGQANAQASRILKRRGYDVFLTDRVGYPDNITLLGNLHAEETEKAIFELADSSLKQLVDKMAARERSIRKYNILDLSLGWLFGLLFNYFGSWSLGKLYIADKKCTACGICVKNCPSKTIRLFNQKPHWKLNCAGCFGCYNICPSGAVQVSILRAIILLVATFGLIPLIILNYQAVYSTIRPAVPSSIAFLGDSYLFQLIAGIVCYFILYILTLIIFDFVFFILEQVPFIRPMFEWSYSTKIRRYKAPSNP